MPKQETLCYLIMPAGTKNEFRGEKIESDYVYNHIKDGLELERIAGHKILVKRETDENKAGAITKNILKNLIQAEICIADLTGHNANVLLELGMRYCFRPRLTVLIAQDVSRIPFDIHSERIIEYSIFKPKDLVDKLKDTIQHGLKQNARSKDPKITTSIVHDLIPESRFTSSLSSAVDKEDAARVMSPHEYMVRVDRIASELSKLIASNSYVPSVFIGLSKGGSNIAEFVSSLLERSGHPQILWDVLWEKDKCFDSPKNKEVLKYLQNRLQSAERYNILLFDDHAATGESARRAKKLVEDSIRTASVHFLPLVCRNRGTLFKLFNEEILLWTHQAVRRTKQQVLDMHYTKKEVFPLNKPIEK